MEEGYDLESLGRSDAVMSRLLAAATTGTCQPVPVDLVPLRR